MTMTKINHKKIIISLIVILIGLLSYASVFEHLIQNSFLKQIDERGGKYLDEVFHRSLVTFAVVRGVNGVISVIQKSDLEFSPAGVGVILAVGEVLEPMNDLIERFSWVMLVSSTSLGIQKVLMQIGSFLGLQILLTFSMIIILSSLWLPYPILKSIGYKMIVLSLLIRFGIPVMEIISEKTYQSFLKEKYLTSSESIESITKDIKEIDTPEPESSNATGLIDKLKSYYSEAKESLKLTEKIYRIKNSILNYTEHVLNLITVFVIQTILIPLLMFWGMIRLIR